MPRGARLRRAVSGTIRWRWIDAALRFVQRALPSFDAAESGGGPSCAVRRAHRARAVRVGGSVGGLFWAEKEKLREESIDACPKTVANTGDRADLRGKQWHAEPGLPRVGFACVVWVLRDGQDSGEGCLRPNLGCLRSSLGWFRSMFTWLVLIWMWSRRAMGGLRQCWGVGFGRIQARFDQMY